MSSVPEWTLDPNHQPEADGEYLVTAQSPGGARVTTTAEWLDGEWEIHGYDLERHAVTAWMPLPEPCGGAGDAFEFLKRELPLFKEK